MKTKDEVELGIGEVDTSHEDVVDVTDMVEVYQNGKCFDCPCGQSIGVSLEIQSVTCATCGKICVDTKHDEREPPTTEQGQTQLTDW